MFTDVIDRADVRVIQTGSRFGLTLETGKGVRIAGYFCRQEFEGDEPMQAHVFCLVNHTHAALGNEADDAETPPKYLTVSQPPRAGSGSLASKGQTNRYRCRQECSGLFMFAKQSVDFGSHIGVRAALC